MTNKSRKNALNRRLGDALKSVRIRRQESLSVAASALGFSELELYSMEKNPIGIPSQTLIRVIGIYGVHTPEVVAAFYEVRLGLGEAMASQP